MLLQQRVAKIQWSFVGTIVSLLLATPAQAQETQTQATQTQPQLQQSPPLQTTTTTTPESANTTVEPTREVPQLPPSTSLPPSCCLPLVLARLSVGMGGLSGPNQLMTYSGMIGLHLGVRLSAMSLSNAGFDSSFYAGLEYTGNTSNYAMGLLSLNASVGGFLSPAVSLSYSPGFVLAFGSPGIGVGMRNSLLIGIIYDVFGIELGHQFIARDTGFDHAIRANLWVDVGHVAHFITMLARALR